MLFKAQQAKIRSDNYPPWFYDLFSPKFSYVRDTKRKLGEVRFTSKLLLLLLSAIFLLLCIRYVWFPGLKIALNNHNRVNLGLSNREIENQCGI